MQNRTVRSMRSRAGEVHFVGEISESGGFTNWVVAKCGRSLMSPMTDRDPIESVNCPKCLKESK